MICKKYKNLESKQRWGNFDSVDRGSMDIMDTIELDFLELANSSKDPVVLNMLSQSSFESVRKAVELNGSLELKLV